MTKYNSADIGFLLVGPYDVKGVTKKLETGVSDPVQETTPFGTTAASFGKPGVKRYEITGHDGWYDDAATSINQAMMDLAAGENVLMFGYKGNTKGLTAICAGGALKSGYKIGEAVGEFHTAQMELVLSGAVQEAIIVATLTSRSGDTNTEADYLDLGAGGVGAAGLTAYVACSELALTGSTNVIFSIEDSTDHIAWAEQVAMTAMTAIGAEKKASTDQTVNRYLAFKQVFTGLAGTPTATAVAAVKVN